MNDFKKKLKVEIGDMKDIPLENNSGKKAVLMRLHNIIRGQISYVNENGSFSTREQAEQLQVLWDINKILDNYDELRPILQKYFAEKHEKEKWER